MAQPNGPFRDLIMPAAVILATLLVASMILDRAIRVFVPPLPAVQVAHPANFHEVRSFLEFSYEFRTNSMGLRYRELPLEKQSDRELRVLVVGDSYAEGYGVSDPERFTEILEESRSTAERPTHFINCGLSGAGPLQYGRILFTTGMRYHPDLALVVIHANDPNDTPVDAGLDLDRANGKFVVRSQPLHWPPKNFFQRMTYRVWPWTYARLQHFSMLRDAKHLESLGFLESVQEQAKRLGISAEAYDRWKARVPAHLLNATEQERFRGTQLAHGLFRPDIMLNSLDISSDAAKAKWLSMQHILSDIVTLCRDSGIPCAFVYAPDAIQYDPSAGKVIRAVGVRVRPEWITEKSELERRLEIWAEREKVPYLSLTNHFRAAAAERPGFYNFELDGHWNANGHRLAATTIGSWLNEQGLVARTTSETQ